MGASLESHYNRKIIYSTDREHKNLYDWSLQELDQDGNKVGRDWIPWEWTLYFRATNILLQETWRTSERYPVEPAKGKGETKERRFVRASLSPDEALRWPPGYSMLGTDRKVTRFDLYIEEVPDHEEERCTTYGIVSYTTEVDFRDITDEDSLTIYFHIHAKAFERIAARVAAGQVDGLTIRISNVAGFYSDWSPGITTDKIRILTADRNHVVEGLPEDLPLRRLGDVGEAELAFAREANLPPPTAETNEAEILDSGEVELARAPRDVTTADDLNQGAVKALQSLRFPAWLIAALLFALLLK